LGGTILNSVELIGIFTLILGITVEVATGADLGHYIISVGSCLIAIGNLPEFPIRLSRRVGIRHMQSTVARRVKVGVVVFRISPMTDPPPCRCKGYWIVGGRKVHDGETLTMNIGIYTNVVPRVAIYGDPQYDPNYPCDNNSIWKVETEGDVSYDREKGELTVRGDGAVIAHWMLDLK